MEELEGEYLIYHQAYYNDPFPELVATIDAESLDDAWVKTQNDGPQCVKEWASESYVIENLTGMSVVRSTNVGDVIVDPNGRAFEVAGSGFIRQPEFDL